MDTKTSAIKPIECFKPGSFVAMDGKRYNFTTADVQEIADTYNPSFADAPLVVGHPKLTSPRFGHAGKLYVNDAGVLCADAADLVPEFAEAVNSKQYPKVSASIYLPNAPGNPTPGKHYLRHIGFLGGVAPAVKGLKSVEFSESDEGIVNFGYEDRMIVQMFRGLREWFISTAGLDKANEIIPSWNIDALAESATREDMAAADAIPGFSNPHQPKESDLDNAARAAQLTQKENDLAVREAVLATSEATIKRASHVDFAETLVISGQLVPAQKNQVAEILTLLDAGNQVVSFAAGDPDQGKTGADLFKQFLSAQPKQVEFRRVSTAAGAADSTVDFAAPPGSEVDTDGLELYRAAVQYQKDHPGTDIGAAAKAVAK